MYPAKPMVRQGDFHQTVLRWVLLVNESDQRLHVLGNLNGIWRKVFRLRNTNRSCSVGSWRPITLSVQWRDGDDMQFKNEMLGNWGFWETWGDSLCRWSGYVPPATLLRLTND